MALSSFMKRIAGRLSPRMQNELKRKQFAHEIRRGRFFTDEQEYEMLDDWLGPGDWALDVGANIGHYTARMSALVGPNGRVIAFEPVPETFELLAANVALQPNRNVSLINAAASDSTGVVGMQIPKFDTGLDNYYMAHLSDDGGDVNIMTMPVDGLDLPHTVKFVKIDAEGHELPVLKGMRALLERDRPVIVLEDNSTELASYLEALGYASERRPGSSNRIFRPNA